MNSSRSVHHIFVELNGALEFVRQEYDKAYRSHSLVLDSIRSQIQQSREVEELVQYLIQKDSIENQIEFLRISEQVEISKIRYIKGLQIIKLLYEKTLALDHHFSSISTLHEINRISNPNNYEGFIRAQAVINVDKKNNFNVSDLLGNNVFATLTHSLITLFNGDNKGDAREELETKEFQCILDFTLQIHADLNTVYFETTFLQKSNESILSEINLLFEAYTKPILYNNTLQHCRAKDDWDSVRSHLNSYLNDLDQLLTTEGNGRAVQKMQINLEFPIDRLLQFIQQYNHFIDQGGKFYEKFGIMLHSYENEQLCNSIIPSEFIKLRESIEIAIEKFNTAYKPIEINGSKMKEVLYGINEYE